MALFNEEDDEDSYYRCTKNKEGLYELSVTIPLMNKTITVSDKDIVKAYDLLYEIFSKEIDAYIETRPHLKEELDKRIRVMEYAQQKNDQLAKAHHKPLSEEEQLGFDIFSKQLTKDIEESLDSVVSIVDDISLILDEDPTRLYIKVLPRNYFAENINDTEAAIRMHVLSRKELKEAGYVPLYLKHRTTKDNLVIVGIMEKM